MPFVVHKKMLFTVKRPQLLALQAFAIVAVLFHSTCDAIAFQREIGHPGTGVGSSPAVDADVVVVGGGLSGLWTATQLKENTQLKVKVLEGRDRVGGRTKAFKDGDDTFDLGAHWVGTSQVHVAKVIEKLGVQTYRQYIKGTKVLDIQGKVRHYKTSIPLLPALQEANLAAFIGDVQLHVSKVPRENPNNYSKAAHFDGMTVESFCEAFPWDEATRQVVEATSRTVFGKDLEDLSALQFLHYTACTGGVLTLVDATPGGAQEFKLVGGTQQLSDGLADSLDVEFNTTVVGIDQSSEDGVITIRTLNGKTFTCNSVVVAIPPHLAAAIWYTPVLPSKKAHLLTRMTQGHLIKVITTYEKPFWRDSGFSGEVVSSAYPLDICYDDTTPGGTPALVCFVGGSSAVEASPENNDQLKQDVVSALVKYFGEDAANPTKVIHQDWGVEPLTGGCPVGSMNAGTITQFGDALRQQHGKIVFGATETATWYPGYMNGAVQAGERCAMEVMQQFGIAVPQEMKDFYDQTKP